MVEFRRNKSCNPDDIFFLVIVTKNRRSWIEDFNCYNFILSQMKRFETIFKMEFKAWVLLPDHIHCLLKPGKSDYSDIISRVKKRISWNMKKDGLIAHGEQLWQARFWEETIRDDDHYAKCLEYIHFNPVKHGMVESPIDWQWSSFHEYVKNGIYKAEWASATDIETLGSGYD